MKPKAVEKLVWVLIYSGLLGAGLGLALRGGEPGLGWTLVVAGGVLAAVGVALIFVRSRMGGDR